MGGSEACAWSGISPLVCECNSPGFLRAPWGGGDVTSHKTWGGRDQGQRRGRSAARSTLATTMPTDAMRRGGVIGPRACGNTGRHVADDLDVEGIGWQNRKLTLATASTTPNPPTTGPRYRGNDTTRGTGHSGRQNALMPRSTRRGERVTAQGPYRNCNPSECHTGGGGVHTCV